MNEICPFADFVTPTIDQRGQYAVTQNRSFQRRSNFSGPQRAALGIVLGEMGRLVSTDSGESMLTTTIVDRFLGEVTSEKPISFPEAVFQSFLDIITATTVRHPELREATEGMLETAGAAGIGSVVNASANYLRKALAERAGQVVRYRSFRREDFVMVRRRVSSEGEAWKSAGSNEVDFEVNDQDFYIVCLGEVFSKKTLEPIRDSARLIANSPDRNVQAALENTDHKILGPKKAALFYDRGDMKARILDHIHDLVLG